MITYRFTTIGDGKGDQPVWKITLSNTVYVDVSMPGPTGYYAATDAAGIATGKTGVHTRGEPIRPCATCLARGITFGESWSPDTWELIEGAQQFGENDPRPVDNEPDSMLPAGPWDGPLKKGARR
jgi:hypothetical protein